MKTTLSFQEIEKKWPAVLREAMRESGKRSLRYSLRRYAVDEFCFRRIPSTSGRVLDLGGHRLQKRGLFHLPEVAPQTVCLNLTPEKSPDVLGDAARIPFANNQFEGIVCTELLEHVEHPAAVISEAHRVLQSGGWIRITVPFLYWIHGDPYDFGRYTDAFWKMNLERTGFEAVEIEKQGGYFSVLFEMIRESAAKLNWDRGPQWRSRLLWKLLNCAKREAVRRDLMVHYREHPHFSRFCTGFGICARKP